MPILQLNTLVVEDILIGEIWVKVHKNCLHYFCNTLSVLNYLKTKKLKSIRENKMRLIDWQKLS